MRMFIYPQSVKRSHDVKKIEHAEGFDRIPQRVLVDGVEVCFSPGLLKLLEFVYSQCTILAQWLVADTVPVCKNKGLPKDIENYRPIANLNARLT